MYLQLQTTSKIMKRILLEVPPNAPHVKKPGELFFINPLIWVNYLVYWDTIVIRLVFQIAVSNIQT